MSISIKVHLIGGPLDGKPVKIGPMYPEPAPMISFPHPDDVKAIGIESTTLKDRPIRIIDYYLKSSPWQDSLNLYYAYSGLKLK